MDELVEHLLGSNVIDVGEVKITKTSLGKLQGFRYLVYLPTTRNYLWEKLHAIGRKVRVYIEVPDDVVKKKS